MRVQDLRPIDLLAGLSDEQLGELLAAGTEVPIEPDVELFHEGDHADFWFLLVDGAIELSRTVGREQAVVGRMDLPGRWSGGFRAWDEHGVYLATGRGTAAGRVLRVPATALRERADAWFPFGGHLIAGLYGTARRIESTVRQRESLVTLGTLAAGLAHEINNPAAAATRAVDALQDACGSLLSSLERLARGEISAAQFVALDELRRQITPPAGPPDPLALADLEDALSDWLAGHGVAKDWVIAPPLAAAGVGVQWCDQAAAILGDAVAPGLEWVANTLSATTLLGELKDSTRRISELVAAVRSYSQMDRGSLQQLDVTEGLESTLVMLGHKLREESVTVERDYGADLPRIEAYAGELNQVWTNLIDNAIDAMHDDDRTLRVCTRRADERVVVEIADTGEGMPPEVAARAFEAFYSTKDVGKGTGLGLDIARRIVVERHAGTIDIESGGNGTVLRVTLPIRAGRRE
ncbi:sensor histidine kinase [Nakamurella lactea]|uniref:sensor histidine kinase n=1 Tax=Nakamurella lactea TaxID=459515 RepID=UPI000405B561|nr:ATP-binding protein [Nakamurella lactea]